MLVTALAPKIGYDKAAKIAKAAHAERHDFARGGGSARLCHRGGVRPPGAAGADGAAGLTGPAEAIRTCT